MSADQENYERALWQSARTKDGKVAELPLSYLQAWDAAHKEQATRQHSDQARMRRLRVASGMGDGICQPGDPVVVAAMQGG